MTERCLWVGEARQQGYLKPERCVCRTDAEPERRCVPCGGTKNPPASREEDAK